MAPLVGLQVQAGPAGGRITRKNAEAVRCEIQCHSTIRRLTSISTSRPRANPRSSSVELPSRWVDKLPVFLPTRELLTIYPGFVSVYENHYLEFEETWRDTCLLLGAPAFVGRKNGVQETPETRSKRRWGQGRARRRAGAFISTPRTSHMEMPLVAEGHRKLAMIAQLIATGSLLDKGYLFWDEPETNLNPKLIKQVAETILHLCQNGIQVFIATHSLFLMRECDILMQISDFKGTKSRFIGLQYGVNGIDVEQGDTVDEIGAITALDEDLRQSDRYIVAGA